MIGFLALSPLARANEAASVTFKKRKISLGSQKLTVEVAETPAQLERGLMFRESLAGGTGMLFIFPNEAYRSFWMKNTYVDLTIGYFDKHRRLFETLDMKASSAVQTQFPTYPSRKPAQYALEVPQGWFKTHSVKIGDSFKFD
ncbi:MAG: DUF192 domain-containing protein [Bdellovibrionales bacterium]